MARHRDRDGIERFDTRGARARRAVLASALAGLGVAAWLVARWTRAEPPLRTAPLRTATTTADAAPVATADARRVDAPPAPAREKPIRREERAKPPSGHQAAPDAASDEEETYTLNAPGEKAGLAAFPPPGTKPIKRGIVVPDDFVLPDGYVRHYQTADDGRRLPPILMFHPDYQGVDANGNPVALPADRVVPPEMAPQGLPIQILDPEQHAGIATPGRAR